MNPIVYRIQLDAGKPGSQLQINAKAGEHASRKIIATIFKDNEVFTPPSGATAALRAQSESGTKFYNACTISGCEIEYELGSNMLASACFISCEIVVIGVNNEVLCSPGFDIYVEDILFSDAVVEQGDEFTALTTALSRVSNIEASEAGRVSAENARVAAETLRESAEEVRDASEDDRVAAELERESAEELRVSNENARDTAEDARIAAELTRTSQEAARESAEDSRESAEAARQAAEQDRVSAESARVSSEQTRETQESARQSNTASAVQNANAAADRANAAAKSCEDIAGGNYPSHASTHASGGSDPITPASIGAAAASHTHSEYAASDHNHDSVYAAKVHTHDYAASNHTHTPESIGASAADHTHTPESIGAAAADHTHTPESIGAMGVGADNGAVGTKYTTTIEPDTADKAASVIRIKDNASGNTRVLIATNEDSNNAENETSQLVLRNSSVNGRVILQANNTGKNGLRVVDENGVDRIGLYYGTNENWCGFEIYDQDGNDVTLETIGAQERFLCGRNQTIATSAWASDTTYADYPYRASLALPSITALSFVEIVFSPADATSGNFAPVCDTYAGGVYLYAKAVPDAAITIPTIIVWR